MASFRRLSDRLDSTLANPALARTLGPRGHAHRQPGRDDGAAHRTSARLDSVLLGMNQRPGHPRQVRHRHRALHRHPGAEPEHEEAAGRAGQKHPGQGAGDGEDLLILTLTLRPCSPSPFSAPGPPAPPSTATSPALAVQREGETILFDCGEGTQRQMMRYGVGFSFTEIFFTHYHADHMLGVTGLLRTMGLQDRTAPVTLYGPRGAQRILGAAIESGDRAQQVSGRDRGDQAGRPAAARRVRHRGASRPSTGPTPSATRSPSTPGSGASTRTGRASWAFPRARSGAGCTRARRSRSTTAGPSSPADLVGAPRPWPHRGLFGRHPAAPRAARGRPGRRPADPRGHLRRRRAGAGPGDRPLHRGRGGAGRARGRASAGSSSPTSARATPATRPSCWPRRGRCFRTRSSRGTG